MVSLKNTKAIKENGCGPNTQVEDIEWLSSLSEPELDFLISLKELVAIRAKNIGHVNLANKFDIKLLRALGFILLEHFKEHVRNTPAVPDADKLLASLSCCRLADTYCHGNPDTVTHESKSATMDSSFVGPSRKRMWDGVCEGKIPSYIKPKRTKNK